MSVNPETAPRVILPRFRALLANARIRDVLLPSVPPSQIDDFERLLEPVYRDSHEWVSRYRILNSNYLIAPAVFKVVQMPALAVADIATAVKWEVWVFAIDDLFDRRALSFPEIQAIVEECRAVGIASPGKESTRSDYGSGFAEIKRLLTRHRSFRPLEAAVFWGLERLFGGMAYAYAVHSAVSQGWVPPLDEYLFHARDTLIHPFVWALPLYDDDSVLHLLPKLTRLADRCSTVLRLANDLSTVAREELEGNLNAVAIVEHEVAFEDPSAPATARRERAVQIVQARLEEERMRAYDESYSCRTESRLEEGFLRLVEIGLASYLRLDVREWVDVLAGSRESTEAPPGG
jgi:Terpene synthase family 2, C-terminal metal binding